MKKVLFCLLSLPTLILAFFIPMVAVSGGFSIESYFVIALILIWLALLFVINGFAIFLSDEGFGKTSFIIYASLGGAALVDSLIMLLTFEGQDYPVMLLKYAALPIMLCVIIYRYINVGYGHEGWVGNLLMPVLLVSVPYVVFWLFAKFTSNLVANLVLYGIALAGAVFAVVKSLQEGGLANANWGYGSSSGGYSGDSHESSRNFTPAQPYEIERMLWGMTARDLHDTIQYEITRVEAHTSDGGYNFDITIYVKVDTVYGAKLSRISNEYDRDRVSYAAASKLMGLVTSKLRARGVGYNVHFQD